MKPGFPAFEWVGYIDHADNFLHAQPTARCQTGDLEGREILSVSRFGR